MTADLPESEYAPSDALVPATPDGYHDPSLFEHPFVILLLGSVVLLLIATLLFGGVLWTVQGPAVFEALAAVTETPTGFTVVVDMTLVVGVTVLALGTTVVVHELVHGAAFGRYGYRVSYGAMPQIGGSTRPRSTSSSPANTSSPWRSRRSSPSRRSVSRCSRCRCRWSPSSSSCCWSSTRSGPRATSTSSPTSSGDRKGRCSTTATSGTPTCSSRVGIGSGGRGREGPPGPGRDAIRANGRAEPGSPPASVEHEVPEDVPVRGPGDEDADEDAHDGDDGEPLEVAEREDGER